MDTKAQGPWRKKSFRCKSGLTESAASWKDLEPTKATAPGTGSPLFPPSEASFNVVSSTFSFFSLILSVTNSLPALYLALHPLSLPLSLITTFVSLNFYPVFSPSPHPSSPWIETTRGQEAAEWPTARILGLLAHHLSGDIALIMLLSFLN